MRKSVKIFSAAVFMFASVALISCGKNKCEVCEYYKNGVDTEIGEYCGDDLKNIEKNGYTDSTGVKHDVHCGGH
jgi:hypothetical protein